MLSCWLRLGLRFGLRRRRGLGGERGLDWCCVLYEEKREKGGVGEDGIIKGKGI